MEAIAIEGFAFLSLNSLDSLFWRGSSMQMLNKQLEQHLTDGTVSVGEAVVQVVLHAACYANHEPEKPEGAAG